MGNGLALGSTLVEDDSPVEEVAVPVKAKKVEKRRQKSVTTANKESAKPWTTVEEVALCQVCRLRKEQEKEYQLINNLLGEINHYMLKNLDRAEKKTRVTTLPPDEPLKTFTLQTLRLSSVSDKCIATILEAAREKVI
nr:hypothetical protein [Tanacetum cinerariifolium]